MKRIKNEPNINPIRHVLLQYKIQIKHFYFDKRQILRQNMHRRVMNLNRSKYFSLNQLSSSDDDLIDMYRRLPLVSPCSCNSFLTCKENLSLENTKVTVLDAYTQTSLDFFEINSILDFLNLHLEEFRTYLNSRHDDLVIPEKTTEPFFLHKKMTSDHSSSKTPTNEGDSNEKISETSMVINGNQTQMIKEAETSKTDEKSKKESRKQMTPYYDIGQNIQKQNPLLMAELKKTLKRPNFNLKSINIQ